MDIKNCDIYNQIMSKDVMTEIKASHKEYMHLFQHFHLFVNEIVEETNMSREQIYKHIGEILDFKDTDKLDVITYE